MHQSSLHKMLTECINRSYTNC